MKGSALESFESSPAFMLSDSPSDEKHVDYGTADRQRWLAREKSSRRAKLEMLVSLSD